MMFLKSWAKRTAAYESRHLYPLALLLPTIPEVAFTFLADVPNCMEVHIGYNKRM